MSSSDASFPVRIREGLRQRLKYAVFLAGDGNYTNVVSSILDAHLPEIPDAISQGLSAESISAPKPQQPTAA